MPLRRPNSPVRKQRSPLPQRQPNSPVGQQRSPLPRRRPDNLGWQQQRGPLPQRRSDGRQRQQVAAWGLLRARTGAAPARRIVVSVVNVVAATSAAVRSVHFAWTRRHRSITRIRPSCASSSLTVAASKEGGGRAYARSISAGWLSPSSVRATWRCSRTRRSIFDRAGRFLPAARLEGAERNRRGQKALVVSSKLTQVVHGRPDG